MIFVQKSLSLHWDLEFIQLSGAMLDPVVVRAFLSWRDFILSGGLHTVKASLALLCKVILCACVMLLIRLHMLSLQSYLYLAGFLNSNPLFTCFRPPVVIYSMLQWQELPFVCREISSISLRSILGLRFSPFFKTPVYLWNHRIIE